LLRTQNRSARTGNPGKKNERKEKITRKKRRARGQVRQRGKKKATGGRQKMDCCKRGEKRTKRKKRVCDKK